MNQQSNGRSERLLRRPANTSQEERARQIRRRPRRFMPYFIFGLLIIAIVALVMYFSGKPEAEPVLSATFFGGSDHATVDGKDVTLPAMVRLDQGILIAPVSLCKSFGATVDWDDAQKTAHIEWENYAVDLTVAQNTARVNEQDYSLSLAPSIRSDLLYVPLADLFACFDLESSYTETTTRLDIYQEQEKEPTPQCSFSTDKSSYAPGELVTFTASAKDGDDSEIVAYAWDNKKDRYFESGRHTVTLKVKNSRGVWSEPFQGTVEITGTPYEGGDSVSILMYHLLVPASEITPDSQDYGNASVISIEQFESELAYLKENGYQTLFVSELVSYLQEGEIPPPKSVVLTFDDGYECVHTVATPLLQKYGLKANAAPVFSSAVYKSEHNANYPGRRDSLDLSMIGDMQTSGVWEIGSHTFDGHGIQYSPEGDYLMSTVDQLWIDGIEETEAERDDRVLNDLLRTKYLLYSELKEETPFFVYPYGAWSDALRNMLISLGFSCAITTKEARVTEVSDLFTLERFNIRQGTTLEEFAAIL